MKSSYYGHTPGAVPPVQHQVYDHNICIIFVPEVDQTQNFFRKTGHW